MVSCPSAGYFRLDFFGILAYEGVGVGAGAGA